MDKMILVEELKKFCINSGFPSDGPRFDGRLRLIYSEFETINNEVFRRACKYILRKTIKFPTIADFESSIKDAGQAIIYNGDDAPAISCDLCDGFGYVSSSLIQKEKVVGDYVFRCPCENGTYRARALPLWEDSKRDEGFVLRTELDGLSGLDIKDGCFIAKISEQQARINIVKVIIAIMRSKLKDEAQDSIVDLNDRIDKYREGIVSHGLVPA